MSLTITVTVIIVIVAKACKKKIAYTRIGFVDFSHYQLELAMMFSVYVQSKCEYQS